MTPPGIRGSRVRVLACGILREELRALPTALLARLDIVNLDSILHMRPRDLESGLHGLLDSAPGVPAILVFGDCSPGMRELSLGPGRVRISGVNCCEIVLGRERYRDLRRRETFLFMPEWTARWREVFGAELGFQSIDAARGFMTDSMQSLAYVDTGVVPVPVPTLREIEDFFGMPVRIEHAGIGLLEKAVLEALKILDAQELNLTEGDFGRGRGGHPK
ncbi:MAG: DUF1638 domain-containing protein [Treponema sp.]|nr:DUF1638 domain-containing protein [Treponema sp.]